VYCALLLKGFPLEFGIGAWGQKAKVVVLHGLARSTRISSAVWIQYANVMDGRTPGDSKD